MSSCADTHWEEVKHPAATSLADQWAGLMDSDEDSPRNLNEAQFDTNAPDQKDSNSTSTVSEQIVPDQHLAASFKVVTRQRDRLIGRRVTIVNQITKSEYQRNAVYASTLRVGDAAEALISRYCVEASSSPEIDELREALQESIELGRTLDGMESKLKQSTKNLNLKESELYLKEKRVYKRLAQIVGLTHQPQDLEDKQVQRDGSSSSKSTTRTHPRARRYYDRAGEAKILRERIHNMQVQHRHDLASRKIQRDSGLAVNISDRLFHEIFYAKLASLLQELEEARKDSFLLKLACQRQGIALEDGSEPQDDRNIIDVSLKDGYRLLSYQSRNQNGKKLSLLRGDLLSGYIDTTTRIRRWLNTMPQHMEDMVSAQPFTTNYHGKHGANESAVIFSDPFTPPPSKADVPMSIEIPGSLNISAPKIKETSPLEDLEISDRQVGSEGSSWPSTSSDREFPQQDLAGDAPIRRYSDPSPTNPFLLRSHGFQIVSYINQERTIRNATYNSV
jgi:hypothetical protein